MTESAAGLLAADAAARQAALDIRRHVLLQAPAGSGKTTVLVCRLLKLLAAADTPEEILAITFTRKAAAEMRGRVLRALQAAQAGSDADSVEASYARAAWQHSEQQGWQLHCNPARLRIATIDSECYSLAAQSPVQSGGVAGLNIVADAGSLYLRAAATALQSALSEPALAVAMEHWLQRLDNDWERLETLLAGMLPQRVMWLPLVLAGDHAALAAQVNASMATLVAAAMQQLLDAMPSSLVTEGAAIAAAIGNRGELDSDEARAWQRVTGTPQAQLGDLPRWRFLAGLLLQKSGEWRQKLDKRNGLPTSAPQLKQRALDWLREVQAGDAMLPAWQEIAALPDCPLSADDSLALQSLAALLRHCSAELQLEFAARRQVDFPYIAGAARRALSQASEPTAMALRASARLRHLLVDEFQDTSVDQLQLIRALTVDWLPGDGRTLFMVGDPMQSIYQFRQAEVGNFLQVRDFGLGDLTVDWLQLRVNFRARAPLVAWVNQAFDGLFPVADDPRTGAIRFLPATPQPNPQPNSQPAAPGTGLSPRVQVHAFAAATPVDQVLEAERVVEIVTAAWQEQPGLSIAVLVGNRRHAVPIGAALQRAGIAVRAQRMTPLGERAVVRDLLALARALQHPNDRVAWLALLRSPLCGLDLQELELLVADSAAGVWDLLQDSARSAGFSAATTLRVQRLQQALQPAIAGTECRVTLSQRVHACWLRLGGPAVCRHPNELADARACLAALSRHGAAELLTGADFEPLLAELYATPEDSARQVEILTIHGAKGLQWDVVIAPQLGRMRAPDDPPALRVLQLTGFGAGNGLLVAPLPHRTSENKREPGSYIKRLADERLRLERQRQLYVLATRARIALHLSGHTVLRASGAREPQSRSLLADFWPALRHEFSQQQALLPATPGAGAELPATAPGVMRERLRASWRPSPQHLPVERLQVPTVAVTEAMEFSWVGQTARAVGTVVHAELLRVAQRLQAGARGTAGIAVRAEPEIADYELRLAELGVPAAARADAAREVRAAVQGAQSDAQGRWLLDGALHPYAGSEVRLSGLSGGLLVNVSIDRMLVDSAGQPWVVDFKTNRHEGGALEEFLARESRRYRPQLARYAELAARLGPEPIRCALYFPLLSVLREVLL